VLIYQIFLHNRNNNGGIYAAIIILKIFLIKNWFGFFLLAATYWAMI